MVVLVVAPYFNGQEWGGESSWEPYIFPWKTICLSGTLRIKVAKTGAFVRNSIYCVFEDKDLEPLSDDDDDGLSLETERDKPIETLLSS